jgi:deazaflavin-dependent oxidoreductase (nitroreductase family)
MLLIAGKPHSGIAILTHKGRVSGKLYHIPIMTSPCPGGFAFALTYGKEVDWYKNLKACGFGKLKWHGVDYLLSNPRTISMQEGQRLFRRVKGTILRWIRLEDYILTDASIDGGKTKF